MLLLTSSTMTLTVYDDQIDSRVPAYKAYEMSDMSPLGQRWVVGYFNTSKGQRVKVVLYTGEVNCPSSRVENHWLINALDDSTESLAPFAREIGFSVEGLVSVLCKYARHSDWD